MPAAGAKKGQNVRRRSSADKKAKTSTKSVVRKGTSLKPKRELRNAGPRTAVTSPVDLDRVLKTAKAAALRAGAEIRRTWSKTSSIKNTKSCSTDLVTETDQLCERIVIGMIRKSFPGHAIIGEESTGSERYELTDAPTWTIDPIDGTTNFVHRLAQSCVIISFLEKRQARVGVVYDPVADELFWAKQGTGAFVQGGASCPGRSRKLRASETTSLNRAVVNMEVGYKRDPVTVTKITKALAAVMRRSVRSVRMLGSTGLNMAYVACGRLDACFEEGHWSSDTGPKIWDFAAGRLLVEEAGGVTRDIGGKLPTEAPLDYMQRSCFCACTPELARELLECVVESQ